MFLYFLQLVHKGFQHNLFSEVLHAKQDDKQMKYLSGNYHPNIFQITNQGWLKNSYSSNTILLILDIRKIHHFNILFLTKFYAFF